MSSIASSPGPTLSPTVLLVDRSMQPTKVVVSVATLSQTMTTTLVTLDLIS